jgi:hypothetical protein
MNCLITLDPFCNYLIGATQSGWVRVPDAVKTEGPVRGGRDGRTPAASSLTSRAIEQKKIPDKIVFSSAAYPNVLRWGLRLEIGQNHHTE